MKTFFMRTAIYLTILSLLLASCQKQATSALQSPASTKSVDSANNTPAPAATKDDTQYEKYYGVAHLKYIWPSHEGTENADSIYVSFPSKDSIQICHTPVFDSSYHLVSKRYRYKLNAASFYGDSTNHYNYTNFIINSNTITMNSDDDNECADYHIQISFTGTQK